MDIQKYIESGILEEYCLGLLHEEDCADVVQMMVFYPEIKARLRDIELTLEKWLTSEGVEPDADMRQKVLTSLGFTDPDILTIVDKNADHQTWLNALKHLIPDEPLEELSIQVIRKDDQVQQMLVIAKVDVPEEEHGDYIESFFILKGRCECTVGNQLFELNEGDFLEIPMHVKHDVKMLTPYVAAVLQYRFV
jgi:mannose-6-phosphate isomerase-like protein (cupin superfamily)